MSLENRDSNLALPVGSGSNEDEDGSITSETELEGLLESADCVT